MADLVPELLVQELPGPENMSFYSPDGEFEHLGDLLVAPLLLVPQADHLLVFLRKPTDCLV